MSLGHSMAKLDWDREQRAARLRARGSIPHWIDPSAVSYGDRRKVDEYLKPLVDLLDEFAAMSRTQRSQREGEFKHRLGRLQREAMAKAGGFDNNTAQGLLAQRAQIVIERFGELAAGQ
jgi:hypothetical protein